MHGAFGNWGPAWFVVLPFVILPLMLALVAWARYLQHKETLRMLESGPQARDLIEFTRSTRLRRGLALGIGLLALGAGLGAGLSAADEAGVVGPAAAAALIGLSVFLFALGCGTVLLHVLWMRQARVAAPRGKDGPQSPSEPNG